MESWERIFDGVFEMKFELRDFHVLAGGDLGVVITEENLTQRAYEGTMRTQVLATNVYERVGNKWLMVLHHGSPVMQPASEEPPLQ